MISPADPSGRPCDRPKNSIPDSKSVSLKSCCGQWCNRNGCSVPHTMASVSMTVVVFIGSRVLIAFHFLPSIERCCTCEKKSDRCWKRPHHLSLAMACVLLSLCALRQQCLLSHVNICVTGSRILSSLQHQTWRNGHSLEKDVRIFQPERNDSSGLT